MRMVVALGDLDASRWVNLTGVSGHAFDAHYADQTDLWVDGETLPWPFSRRERSRRASRRHADPECPLRRAEARARSRPGARAG